MDLRTLRAQEKITQWELRKRTEIPQSKISLFEQGHIELTADEKKKIADALGVSVDGINWGTL
jgi:transcriptional regulator with XRE-family HTH domain